MNSSNMVRTLILLFAFGLAACHVTLPPVYSTYGVHNPPAASPCAAPHCRYVRAPGEPADPIYPEYWTSPWTMYRVYSSNYAQYPPPWAGKPPAPLQEGVDYEVSHGASYYDSTWRGATGEGAMMEHYEKRCLPIFPIPNNYTCSFISLGDIAYFVTYPEDRPDGMPPVCLFSPVNHPPRRDFISHLPYSAGDSQRLGGGGQGYSFWIAPLDEGKVIKTGASPDRTDYPGILFGYAFKPVDGVMQPQSFYFSGQPVIPADPDVLFAPYVSQNYTKFTIEKPDPATTWDRVSGLDIRELPPCHLFEPEGSDSSSSARLLKSGKRAPTWADIGRSKRK